METLKKCQTSDTRTKIIKLNSDILSNLIYKHFNYCIDKGKFPNDSKHAILFQYIRKIICEKENYRPISIQSNFSIINEKLIYNQLYDYSDNILYISKSMWLPERV